MKTIEERSPSFSLSGTRAAFTDSWLRLLVAFVVGWCAQHVAAQKMCQRPVQFGITGHYRVGCWTAIRVPENLTGFTDQRTVVETLDGDGMRVEYEQPILSEPTAWAYAVAGSEEAPVTIFNQMGTLLSTRFPQLSDSPARGPSVIPLGMPWIVSVGDALGVDTIGANELLNREATVAVSKPVSNDFPDSPLGYDGVDLMMISSSGDQVLQELSDKQAEAIKQWVLGGGRLFVTLGGATEQLTDAAPWLCDLLPLEKDSLRIRSMDPSALETYTSTQQPLDNFDGVILPRGEGRVLITGRTAQGQHSNGGRVYRWLGSSDCDCR